MKIKFPFLPRLAFLASRLLCACLLALGLGSTHVGIAAETADKLGDEVKDVVKILEDKDSSIKKFFKEAQGYAVFPKVAKGGVGIGGAFGTGQVFEKGKLVGSASLSQATIGLQFGGQVYSEVIFFESEKALADFKLSKFAMSAQVSAVAAAEGASANAKYQNGVAVFTVVKGGLMYEASVGGQKFKFTPAK